MGAKRNGPMLMHSAVSSSGVKTEDKQTHSRKWWQGGKGHEDDCEYDDSQEQIPKTQDPSPET